MSAGELFVVATPIGNLEDISPRAAGVLGDVDLVVAEDTRHSRPLLTHLGVNPRLRAMHEHNEDSLVPELIDRLRRGQSIAVISDAGTPLISDPGFRLVRAAQDAGITVRAVPGPSAVTAALSVCGMPTDRFGFEGFLPAREGARREKLRSLAQEPRTLVMFETGRRVLSSLADIEAEIGPDRDIAVCRELTKRFETVIRGTVAEVRAALEADPDQRRGEFVIVMGGADRPDADLASALALARELAKELPASKAARIAARLTGAPRRELFAALGEEVATAEREKGKGGSS